MKYVSMQLYVAFLTTATFGMAIFILVGMQSDIEKNTKGRIKHSTRLTSIETRNKIKDGISLEDLNFLIKK